MLSVNNILAPKDGSPITVPTQDMILGSYYLTHPGSEERGRELEKGDGKYSVRVGAAEIALSEEKQERLAKNHVETQKAVIGCRPEHISLDEKPGAMIEGVVDVSEMMGSSVHLHIDVDGKDCIIIVPTLDLDTGNLGSGAKVRFTFAPNSVHMFDPETEENLENLEFMQNQ